MSDKHQESSPHREADEQDAILHAEVNEDTDSLAMEDNDSLQNQNSITDADQVEYGYVSVGEADTPLPDINNTDNLNTQEVGEDLSNSQAVMNDRVDCNHPLTSCKENERTKTQEPPEEVNKCAVPEQTTMIAAETCGITPEDKNIVECKELGNIAVRKSPDGLGVAAEDEGRLRSITTTNTNATPRVISPVPDRVRRHPMDSKTTSEDDSSQECKHQWQIYTESSIFIQVA